MLDVWRTLLERGMRFCSEAPHSQFGEGARPHLCLHEWNHSTPVRRRLSLTQPVRGKLTPTGLALVLGIKTQSLEVFLQYSAFHLWFAHSESRMPSPARLSKRLYAAGINGRLDLIVSLGECPKTHLKKHTRYDQGPEIHGKPRRVSLPVGEAQLAGCLKVWVSAVRWSGTQASSDYAQGVIQDTVYEASVSAATPDWCAVISC